jgi:sugar lactone lactonase YvrE
LIPGHQQHTIRKNHHEPPLTCALRRRGGFLAAVASAALVSTFNLPAATPLQIAQEAYLKASNTSPNDWFGYAVAVSGDTVVVGAYMQYSRATGVNGNQSDNSAPGAGAAYVFVRNGTNWSQQAYLKASNTVKTYNGRDDRFGSSVAMSGDTVVVGAPHEESNATGVNGNQSDNSAYHAGAAYVFVRKGTNWTQQGYLKASNADVNDAFGCSVAVSGDRVIVGAYRGDSIATGVNGDQCDNSATNSGAAYVFELNADPKAVMTGPPEIAVEQPPGIALRAGAAIVDFGGAIERSSSQQRTFTIKNTGQGALTNLAVTISGAHSNEFRVSARPPSTVSGPCGRTFTVTFSPGALGPRTAILHLTSNDPDESPFDITLTGTGMSQSVYTPYAFTNFAGMPGGARNVDGTGSAARFSYPAGVAVDSAGNVYVADFGNHTIRKVTLAGAVTTLAGSAGQRGSTDGTGSAARFSAPSGVAVDNAGNIYVLEPPTFTVRKVTPAGVVTTLAGSAGQSGSADGIGSAARFGGAFGRFLVFHGLAADSAGNVFVADSWNRTIRKITPAGAVTTLSGSAGVQGRVDGASGLARFNSPTHVAVDSTGNVYVADTSNHTIRKITPAGEVTTLAGSAEKKGSADGVGSKALFSGPHGVAVDSAGNVYVADGANHRITKGTPVLAPTAQRQRAVPRPAPAPVVPSPPAPAPRPLPRPLPVPAPPDRPRSAQAGAVASEVIPAGEINIKEAELALVLELYQELAYQEGIGRTVIRSPSLSRNRMSLRNEKEVTRPEAMRLIEEGLRDAGVVLVPRGDRFAFALPPTETNVLNSIRQPPGPPTPSEEKFPPGILKFTEADAAQVVEIWAELEGRKTIWPTALPRRCVSLKSWTELSRLQALWLVEAALRLAGVVTVREGDKFAFAVRPAQTNSLPRFNREAALAKAIRPVAPPELFRLGEVDAHRLVSLYAEVTGRQPLPLATNLAGTKFSIPGISSLDQAEVIFLLEALAHVNGAAFELVGTNQFRLVATGNQIPRRLPIVPGPPPIRK